MAVRIMHVDDLDNAEDRDVPADETVPFGLDGVAYTVDLTAEHAAELRDSLKKYVAVAAVNGAATPSKPAPRYPAATGDTPLKASRRYFKRMRAFADSRADLGEKQYLTASDNFSYTRRLRDAYAEYEAQHGPFPLPDDPQ